MNLSKQTVVGVIGRSENHWEMLSNSLSKVEVACWSLCFRDKKRDSISSLQRLMHSASTLTTSILERGRRQIEKYKGSGQSRIEYETAWRADPGIPKDPLSCLMGWFEGEHAAASDEKAEEGVKRPDTWLTLSREVNGR